METVVGCGRAMRSRGKGTHNFLKLVFKGEHIKRKEERGKRGKEKRWVRERCLSWWRWWWWLWR